jgi:WD40 repeat protein
VTPGGRRAVSGSENKTLRVWDLESGACLRVLEGHTMTVGSVDVTSDGHHAVIGRLGSCVTSVGPGERCVPKSTAGA